MEKNNIGAIKPSSGDRVFYIICGAIIVLLTLTVLYPIIYIISASMSSAKAVNSGEMWLWPVDITFVGYKYVLNYKSIWIGYRNTIFYSFGASFIGITLTMFAAYPLSRRTLKGRRFFSLIFTFTMIFSGGMIPNYLLIKNLGMTNTVWAMLIVGSMSVYNMIVARTFIQSTIPDELVEASRIDGCSDVMFFFKILLPLSVTIIAVLSMTYIAANWNSYFNAFLYLSDKKLYPLQIFLRQILVQSNFDSDMLDPDAVEQLQTLQMLLKYSVIVISTMPMLFIYPFFQKYFQKGVMIGSIKG